MNEVKIDENLPAELAEILRTSGHDAVTVRDQEMSRASDARIVQACQEEDRILVSLDTGFADVRTYPPSQFPGFMILRLAMQDKHHLLRVFERVVPLLKATPVAHRLWIIEEDRVRIRNGGEE